MYDYLYHVNPVKAAELFWNNSTHVCTKSLRRRASIRSTCLAAVEHGTTVAMRPRLVDPNAGPAGARAYIGWWGNALYLDWCEHLGGDPLPYRTWEKRTLEEGKDWWVEGQ